MGDVAQEFAAVALHPAQLVDLLFEYETRLVNTPDHGAQLVAVWDPGSFQCLEPVPPHLFERRPSEFEAAVKEGALKVVDHFDLAVPKTRELIAILGKLEIAGKVLPGFAGVLMVAAALLAPSGWGVVCAALAIPLMFIGRAVYELIVFRKSGGGPAAH